MARIPAVWETSPRSSTLTFTKVTSVNSVENFSNLGAMTLQGLILVVSLEEGNIREIVRIRNHLGVFLLSFPFFRTGVFFFFFLFLHEN